MKLEKNYKSVRFRPRTVSVESEVHRYDPILINEVNHCMNDASHEKPRLARMCVGDSGRHCYSDDIYGINDTTNAVPSPGARHYEWRQERPCAAGVVAGNTCWQQQCSCAGKICWQLTAACLLLLLSGVVWTAHAQGKSK